MVIQRVSPGEDEEPLLEEACLEAGEADWE